MNILGYHNIAMAVPRLQLANPEANGKEICKCIKDVQGKGVSVILFPELCLTGYSCGDLFHNKTLTVACLEPLEEIKNLTLQAATPIVIVGAPLYIQGRLFNCAWVMANGEVLGIVPKSSLPNYKEFYEKRWFASGEGVIDPLAGDEGVKFGTDIIFSCQTRLGIFNFGVEICEDLWSLNPPSNRYALAGATAIFNLSASNELVGKADYRRNLVVAQSAKTMTAYFYASSGIYESVSDVVFGGHMIAAVNGHLVKENERFNRKTETMIVPIDFQVLDSTRVSESCFNDYPIPEIRIVPIGKGFIEPDLSDLSIDPHPFVPADDDEKNRRCQEIFNIQATGLANRLEHIGPNTKAVIGVSGGLDSTLALLVIKEAFKLLGRDPAEGSIAVTMPGFGTSTHTLEGSINLCEGLGIPLRTIDIGPACNQHLQDIAHTGRGDVTFENVQARERTQILMDLANKEGGIVVGTGDLSEMALGWCTYNGDHMSMYAVNCSVPKTLVKSLVSWTATYKYPNCHDEIMHVVDTPISPELLESEDGEIGQKTEDIIGPYELHDFFLYYTIKFGFTPEKIVELATVAFKGQYHSSRIEECMKTFVKRFFGNQFKRNCVPDGPKVGSVSLSPRGDWRMPTEASPAPWLK